MQLNAPSSADESDAGGRTAIPASLTDLPQGLSALKDLDAGQLREEWRRLYRLPAPRLSRDLLMRGIAHRMQELALGGMSKAVRRKLASFAREFEATGKLTPSADLQMRPGARLVREWHGRTHSVAVLEEGFEYAGKVYSSLTQIAETITGAHWSGPRFFGLQDKRLEPSSDRGAKNRSEDLSSHGSVGASRG